MQADLTVNISPPSTCVKTSITTHTPFTYNSNCKDPSAVVVFVIEGVCRVCVVFVTQLVAFEVF